MPTKRVLISLDADLLDRIDRAARRAGATRSGYLRQLAEVDLSSADDADGIARAPTTARDLPGGTVAKAPFARRSEG